MPVSRNRARRLSSKRIQSSINQNRELRLERKYWEDQFECGEEVKDLTWKIRMNKAEPEELRKLIVSFWPLVRPDSVKLKRKLKRTVR